MIRAVIETTISNLGGLGIGWGVIALISFPGKHRAIQRIVGHKKILAAINRLRIKARKPPLEPSGE